MFPWTRPLTNFDIEDVINQTPIRSIFRGTFSRDELSKVEPRRSLEAGVLNLSKSSEVGSHWTAWFKRSKNKIDYFDSYGDLPPPLEFLKYASNCEVRYNFDRRQTFDTIICGQLCLCFLFNEYLLYK